MAVHPSDSSYCFRFGCAWEQSCVTPSWDEEGGVESWLNRTTIEYELSSGHLLVRALISTRCNQWMDPREALGTAVRRP